MDTPESSNNLSAASQTPYRVLARKYRPRNFSELIGQDALVRTLTNAIDSGRIAHAFMLTGVRGVGKTTTARIIARALNYTGPDGTSGPTAGPTDDCAICQAIAQDRHPDVIEMDAASRTGIDDIREILEGVAYAPVSARYKVYIIDEVHMLSKAAFNALLKTLEEPPAHVKFIFATTEIRKVPVTVLSRCQRFDLRRIDADVLADYFSTICEKESVTFEAPAISAIAHAADGSVRDGLSLLDQAIALGTDSVRTDEVAHMLGLSDKSQTLSLYAAALKGDVAEALRILEVVHQSGTDPVQCLQDLMEVAHDLTLLKSLKVSDDALKLTSLPHTSATDAKELASDLAMPALQRSWSLLLKALRDAQSAPDSRQALQMGILRLIYAAELPDPARLMRDIQKQSAAMGATMGSGNAAGSMAGNMGQPGQSVHSPQMQNAQMQGSQAYAPSGPASYDNQFQASGGRPPLMAISGGNALAMATPAPAFMPDPAFMPEAEPEPEFSPNPTDFESLVTLCEDRSELLLASQLVNYVHPVRFEIGRFEFRPTEDAPANLSTRLTNLLYDWTGTRWVLSISREEGSPTLATIRGEARAALRARVLAHPNVISVMEHFSGAELSRVTEEN